MKTIDYSALLQQVLKHSDFLAWTQVADDPQTGPAYRDYSLDDNPKFQLSKFGLYDYREGKVVKTLCELAKELGIRKGNDLDKIEQKNSEGKQMVKTKISSPPEMQRKLDKLRERVADENKENWEAKHWPLVKRYFCNQRGIPEELLNSEFYRKELNVIAQKFTNKTTKETRYELVIPVWGDVKKTTLLQLLKIQINPKTGEKIAKRTQGKLHGEVMPRGVWIGAEKKLRGDRRVMVVEGIEDGLTLRAVLAHKAREEKEKNKKLDGRVIWDVLVTCGVGYFNHAAEWLREYCNTEEKGYSKRIVVLDNDGPENPVALKNSLVFGSDGSVSRYMPGVEKQDANKVLLSSGIEGVWGWLREMQEKGEVQVEEIKELASAEENQEDNECLGNLHTYHFKENPLVDYAVASVFLHRFQRIVRVTRDGAWFVYNTKKGVWEGMDRGSEGKISNFIASLHPAYNREFKRRRNEGMLSEGQERAWRSFVSSLGQTHRVASIQKAIRNADEVICDREEFDSNPELLNCKNGVVNLATGALLPHSPELMQSRQCNVEWPETAEKATCPTFDRFLWDIVCQDQEMLGYKLRQLGYCLSGHTKAKTFFFHVGSGDNGKSVEADMMLRLMGDYARTVSPTLFTEVRGGYSNEEMYELAHLPGVRLAICGETTDRRGWSEGSLKRYTGGTDVITARPIRQAGFFFKPVFKLIIHGNTKPRMATGDQAIWRRLNLVPYDFTAENPDTELDAKLREEFPGILKRLQEGFVEWKAIGLNPPQRCIEANQEYREEIFDDLQRFLESCCVTDSENYETSMRDIYEEYEQFCQKHRRKPRSVSAVGRWLGEQGFGKRKTHGTITRAGIRVRTEEEKTAEEFDDVSPDHESDLDLM